MNWGFLFLCLALVYTYRGVRSVSNSTFEAVIGTIFVIIMYNIIGFGLLALISLIW